MDEITDGMKKKEGSCEAVIMGLEMIFELLPVSFKVVKFRFGDLHMAMI